MDWIRDYINLFVTALGSGGIVYLITYFVKGKKDRAIEQKTIIGYLKARMTKLEKKVQESQKEVQESQKEIKVLQKKFLDLEFKFELTEFEKKLAFEWIQKQPNSQEFFKGVESEVKSKQEFLDRIKNLNQDRYPSFDRPIANIFLVIFFVCFFSLLFYLGYIYTIERLSETANLEIQKETIQIQNNK